MLKKPLLFLLILMLPVVSVYGAWVREEQAIMGTSISVELWHADQQHARQCIANVMQNMRRIDRTMSPYKTDSELSRVNRHAAKEPVRISNELFQLIQQANRISAMTNGSFDISFASIGFLYDFKRAQKPDARQLQQLVPVINYRSIKLHSAEQTIQFASPKTKIDLGGIAKGHAVDQGIAILKQCDIKHAIVSAGGDSRLLGDKRGRPWMTGIRHPRKKGKFALIIPLTDTAISTSGDYERFFMEDGIRYHHIINPASGQPAKGVRSVSILGPDTTTTDALSTASFVMGTAAALKLIESLPGFDAVIIDAKGGTHYTSGLLNPE